MLEINGKFCSFKVDIDMVTCAGQLLGEGQITFRDVA